MKLQLLHLTRSGGIQRREGHAVGGHVQQGNALTQHGKGVCGWLREDAGFPAACHQAEPRFVRREHLDHRTDGLCADIEVLAVMTLTPVRMAPEEFLKTVTEVITLTKRPARPTSRRPRTRSSSSASRRMKWARRRRTSSRRIGSFDNVPTGAEWNKSIPADCLIAS